ncbi:unnamed protein product [Acanthosepion pharaonis]|uniref:Uncharacterized protein n=1 Tax=Acanthosepion pharaonis TaxID=158019 RepID=A0A812DFU4_ACAPH|nr:unnamed protein product [Sepia pharaonis]
MVAGTESLGRRSTAIAHSVARGRCPEHRARLQLTEADDLATPGFAEVDVEVGHRHTFRVQEAFEQQAELQGSSRRRSGAARKAHLDDDDVDLGRVRFVIGLAPAGFALAPPVRRYDEASLQTGGRVATKHRRLASRSPAKAGQDGLRHGAMTGQRCATTSVLSIASEDRRRTAPITSAGFSQARASFWGGRPFRHRSNWRCTWRHAHRGTRYRQQQGWSRPGADRGHKPDRSDPARRRSPAGRRTSPEAGPQALPVGLPSGGRAMPPAARRQRDQTRC